MLVGNFIPLSTWLFCPFANQRCESSSSKTLKQNEAGPGNRPSNQEESRRKGGEIEKLIEKRETSLVLEKLESDFYPQEFTLDNAIHQDRQHEDETIHELRARRTIVGSSAR